MPSLGLRESSWPRMYSTRSDSVGSGFGGGGGAFLCAVWAAQQEAMRSSANVLVLTKRNIDINIRITDGVSFLCREYKSAGCTRADLASSWTANRITKARKGCFPRDFLFVRSGGNKLPALDHLSQNRRRFRDEDHLGRSCGVGGLGYVRFSAPGICRPLSRNDRSQYH